MRWRGGALAQKNTVAQTQSVPVIIRFVSPSDKDFEPACLSERQIFQEGRPSVFEYLLDLEIGHSTGEKSFLLWEQHGCAQGA